MTRDLYSTVLLLVGMFVTTMIDVLLYAASALTHVGRAIGCAIDLHTPPEDTK